MSSLLVDNIGALTTNDEGIGTGPTGVLHDAAMVVEAGTVVWTGPRSRAVRSTDERVDARGCAVVPGFVDSHAHLVFAGDRTDEFVARVSGVRYSAGGIFSTVAATREASSAALEANLDRLVREALASGTTTIECKSGYGLTVEDEAKSLQIARRHTPEVTYLGAHVVPPEYSAKPDDYVHLVCSEMLERCSPLAKWVDVFCDRGAFDADQPPAACRPGPTPTSSVPGLVCRWPWRPAPPRPTTALTSPMPTSSCSRPVLPWPPFCRRLSSPPARRTPMPGGCSTPASRWPWPVTATRGRAIPPISRSVLPSPYGRWG